LWYKKVYNSCLFDVINSFPQKVPPRTNKVEPSADSRVQKLCTQWPLDAALSDLWDRHFCDTIHANKPSDHSLALRRQQQPSLPFLPFTPSDASIPVLLFQRGSPFSASNNHIKNNRKEFDEGWTLIAPRGWGVSFWKSFVFAGARTCGLRDVRAMHFETGTPAFPYDYPGTQPWQQLRDTYKQQATQVWAKKPPAKRANYDLLGVRHPFEAAFETLVPAPWVIQEKNLFATALTMDTKRHIVDEGAWESALVKIRVVLTDGGKPVQNATVHINKDACPIGYLTTAGFSLSLGCGVGNGACTLTGLKTLIDTNR
jgi:ribonuclease P/MRP protein subunit POP1